MGRQQINSCGKITMIAFIILNIFFLVSLQSATALATCMLKWLAPFGPGVRPLRVEGRRLKFLYVPVFWVAPHWFGLAAVAIYLANRSHWHVIIGEGNIIYGPINTFPVALATFTEYCKNACMRHLNTCMYCKPMFKQSLV